MGGLMENLQDILPVTKVKRELLDILKVMEEEDSTITLTRNGEAVGVMMTPTRYQALLETIEILGDKETMKALKASAKDFKAGRVFTDKEVWKD
jgi:PHD/YefM family antitoxin component YafN of YafNO toxin-antitoxin module